MENIVNDPLKVWSIYQISYIVILFNFRIKHLIELGVYKETFIKSVYKVLSTYKKKVRK